MPVDISVRELRAALADPARAFLDVRETAEYNLAHIPGFCSLPRRRIEYELAALVPFRGTPVVVCDDDGRRASLAAATLERLGYANVAVLGGGINRWVSEGHATEWGVNVPSKDFGEKVVMRQGVPELEADELDAWLREGRRVVILDSRTPEEHQRACIPGSRSMPGAELGLRAWELIEEPGTPVVVHCAGRTRSIIGAGTLRRMGVQNVYALKNGTMGWQLAGLTLETGSTRLQLPEVSARTLSTAEARARAIAAEEGVRLIDARALRELVSRSTASNVYLIDVRTREEYAASHIPGFRFVPGGQAVQATDSYIGVRGGAIVCCCDGLVRACMTAAWLRQMGFDDVSALEGGVGAWTSAGEALEQGVPAAAPIGLEAARRAAALLAPAALRAALNEGTVQRVLFVGTSAEFADAHLPGSSWLARGWLELGVSDLAAPSLPLAVTCPSGVESMLAAATLREMGYTNVSVLDGGVDAWREAGLGVERGLAGVTTPPDDVLPSRRSYAEMVNYLRWEEALGEKYR